MMNTDWIKTLVPLIGGALGGPLGTAAAAILADKLGLQEKTVEAVSEVITQGKLTGDQLAGIKAADMEFKKFLETNKIDYEKIANEDTDSARKMQTETQSLMPSALTVILSVGFFGVLGWMLYDDSVINSPPLLIMLGALGNEFAAACKFWLGTTSGSQHKSNLLAQAPAIK
jgi:uncharacterized coiled-coil protein SlyX